MQPQPARLSRIGTHIVRPHRGEEFQDTVFTSCFCVYVEVTHSYHAG